MSGERQRWLSCWLAENELQLEAQKIPNGTHPDVPTGGEENAAVLMEVGAPRQFEFPIKVTGARGHGSRPGCFT